MIRVTVNEQLAAAIAFADGAHSGVGQLRKYTNEPYIVHPVEVLDIMTKRAAAVNVTDAMRIAAILHDVVEDTKVTLDGIRKRWGARVAGLVNELTNVAKPEDGNRATRARINREHIATISDDAKTIKLADVISNTKSIVEHDPAFAKVWLAEKELLLPVLVGGDANLHALAVGLVQNGLQRLKDLKEGN